MADGREPVYYDQKMQSLHHIHVPGDSTHRILQHHYSFIFFADPVMQSYYRRFIRDYMRYKDVIQCSGRYTHATIIPVTLTTPPPVAISPNTKTKRNKNHLLFTARSYNACVQRVIASARTAPTTRCTCAAATFSSRKSRSARPRSSRISRPVLTAVYPSFPREVWFTCPRTTLRYARRLGLLVVLIYIVGPILTNTKSLSPYATPTNP